MIVSFWMCKVASRIAQLSKPSPELDGWQNPTVCGSVSRTHTHLPTCVSKYSGELGNRACTYDVMDSEEEENIVTVQGFLKLIKQCLRLKEGGLFYLGHPCSMMVWVSQSVHRRSWAMPWGDQSQESFLEAVCRCDRKP